MTAAAFLILNGGSSSLKFAVFLSTQDEPPQRQLSGAVERIGQGQAALWLRRPGAEPESQPVAAPEHAAALHAVLELLHKQKLPPLAAIGHRIVHGGEHYAAPARISADMLRELERLIPFAPEHLPAELALIKVCTQTFPELPQVACFDTAFHKSLPTVARLVPLPRRFAAQGIRRYGFHGLSYTFLLAELERRIGPSARRGRHIFLHLGNGSSLAAIRDGVCIDTSMGFTPAAGLVMGTRSGDLDPGLFPYLLREPGMTADKLQHLISHESGLRGLSETSADMRDLLARAEKDSRAAEAIDLYCYQAQKWIGAYAAALSGLDSLVFTGGIGEHAPPVRARICANLGFLGVTLDPQRNEANAPVISTEHSRVPVRVIPTDEERVIAESVAQMIY